MTRPKLQVPIETPAAADTAEPTHAGAMWREHDLLVRRFHLSGLIPAEIAVVLQSKGVRVKTWHVSETFVRNRLKALGFSPNTSRCYYAQGQNRYRPRMTG
jgi:hypothetical protein